MNGTEHAYMMLSCLLSKLCSCLAASCVLVPDKLSSLQIIEAVVGMLNPMIRKVAEDVNSLNMPSCQQKQDANWKTRLLQMLSASVT